MCRSFYLRVQFTLDPVAKNKKAVRFEDGPPTRKANFRPRLTFQQILAELLGKKMKKTTGSTWVHWVNNLPVLPVFPVVFRD